MKLNFKTVVSPALVLFVICLLTSLLLGVTNEMTRGKLLEAQKATEENSRKIVLADATSFEPAADNSYFIGKNDSGDVGYVFITESKGYGGTIKVMTGIGTDDEIRGVVILSQNETPGLGANATKASFTDKYKQGAGKLSVVKTAPAGDGQVEAITGATITSRAVTEAVNLATAAYNDIKGGS